MTEGAKGRGVDIVSRRAPFKEQQLLRRLRITTIIATLMLLALLASVSPTLAALPGEPCPNQQLRVEDHSTALPDCRAYELVTPAFKDGEPIANGVAASDGSRLAFQSLGGFGEPEDDQSGLGVNYVSTRAASGWSTQPINPSAAQFENEVPLAREGQEYNGELTESLFTLVPAGAAPVDFRYYQRDLPDGALVPIGPAISPAATAEWGQSEKEEYGSFPYVRLVGATRDLSHVLFLLNKQVVGSPFWLWSGDSTRFGQSLYEYEGTGNAEPVLVGVTPGPREAADRPAENPALISECGTSLGGGITGGENGVKELDTYNAISTVPAGEEGHTIFFTALAYNPNAAARECLEANGGADAPIVNELYARIDGSHTVAISEPTHEDCAACDTSTAAQEAAPNGALFQGASADGSEVFFLSEQKLFAGANHEEGENLYEYDFAVADKDEKVSLVAAQMAPGGGVVRISEAGSRVYLVSESVLPGATPNVFGAEPHAGADNLYIYDTESHTSRFIAALSSTGDREDWSENDSRPAEATPDGRFLLFTSVNDLTPDAAGAGSQLYRYDSTTGELIRISIGNDGYNQDGNDGTTSVFDTESYTERDHSKPAALSMSADGSKVFFASSGALTPQALDNVPTTEVGGFGTGKASNVYEYESGHVYLITDGRDVAPNLGGGSAVNLIGTTASGDDLFFTTADQLVGQDGDTGQDVYDARVDGGFPAPAAAALCQGEACQPAAGPPPTFGLPGSASFDGSGNLIPAPAPDRAAPKTKPQIAAAKLAKALKACRSKHNRHARTVCESQARRRYHSKSRNPTRANKRSK